MASRKFTFIVNPNSANGSTGREWASIKSRAMDRLGAFEVLMTSKPGSAVHLAGEALRSGADTVVCVGGDGTLNEVVNGLMGYNDSRTHEVLVGLIPRGTGCDFARSVPVSRDLDRALDAIMAGEYLALDLGRLTYSDHYGRPEIRYFHNILSFGLGGEVDERVNRTTKVFGGFLSFIWATLVSILRYDKKRIRLKVDDHFDEEVITWNIAVANGQYHGGGMWVAPGANPSDGLFQVTVIGDMNKVAVFRNLPYLYNGKIYEIEKVKKLVGSRIRASSSQTVLLDMDGEQPGRLPIAIDMVPSAIRIIREA